MYLLIWPAKIFGRFAFRPKLQALEKKVAKNDEFCSTHMNRPEMAESSHKKNFAAFLIKIVAINSYFTKKIENNAKK